MSLKWAQKYSSHVCSNLNSKLENNRFIFCLISNLKDSSGRSKSSSGRNLDKEIICSYYIWSWSRSLSRTPKAEAQPPRHIIKFYGNALLVSQHDRKLGLRNFSIATYSLRSLSRTHKANHRVTNLTQSTSCATYTVSFTKSHAIESANSNGISSTRCLLLMG